MADVILFIARLSTVDAVAFARALPLGLGNLTRGTANVDFAVTQRMRLGQNNVSLSQWTNTVRVTPIKIIK